MLPKIGTPMRRTEDRRFISGAGRYTADINLPGQLYLYVLRSPVAHAKIKSIDTATAAAMPDVAGIATGKDIARAGIRSMPTVWTVTDKSGVPMREPVRPILAGDKVAYVGEPVAAVFAASLAAARDAAEHITLSLEELPVIIDSVQALADNAHRIWDDIPSNCAFESELGDAARVDAAFAQAAHLVRTDIVQNRLVSNPMEPRAALCGYEPALDEYTLYLSNQNPHLWRYVNCRDTLDIPEAKLRVIAPDVGGGFGAKVYQYHEEILAIWGAKHLGRPVKWVGDRTETFLSDAQARDHVTHAEMALDKDGRITALRVRTLANLGAYISMFGASVPAGSYAMMLPGPYAIPAFHSEVKGIFTNTVPVDAYRGAGQPEAAFVMERLIETAAIETGIDRVELRRRNFIPKDAFPYESSAGWIYDTGDYGACLDAALGAAEFDGFETRRAASVKLGKLRGVGICAYVEAAGAGHSQFMIAAGAKIPGYEVGTVRVNPDGTVTALTGSHSHGQGHETTFAQVVADHLQVPFEDVEIVHGDTGQVPFGVGTWGSRSLSAGGSALVVGIDKVIVKGKRIAAHMLEAEADDMEYIDGFFKVRGSDRILSFKDVAREAYLPGNYPLDELEPGLEETTYYHPPAGGTFPSGTHCCEVEIDPETGAIEIVGYWVGDDFGKIINPMIVEGQVQGGVAQGIGQALLEDAIYDPDSGQLMTASFLDYCMPRADDLPAIHVDSIDGYTPNNPLGAKGCGEAGAIGAPGAVINAVYDALQAVGVDDVTMPATPYKVWSAIAAASR